MKVGHEMPVNGVAARVLARGESFEFRALPTEVCSPVPLAVKPVPEGVEDLKGARFGRLLVAGLSQDVKKRWVCRCSCGNYVLRRAEAIKKAAVDSACPQCYLLAVTKRNEFTRRTGKERPTREFMA